REEAALAEGRAPVAAARVVALERKIECLSAGARCQEIERPRHVPVPGLERPARRIALEAIDRFEEPASIAKPIGRQAVEQTKRGKIDLALVAAHDAERIVRAAPRTAADPFDVASRVAELSTPDAQERWQLACAVACDDRAEVRAPVAVGPLLAARKPHRAGGKMVVVPRDVGADEREAVVPFRKEREDLGEVDAGDARGDRREEASKSGRRIRLGVEGVDVARAAPKPKKD